MRKPPSFLLAVAALGCAQGSMPVTTSGTGTGTGGAAGGSASSSTTTSSTVGSGGAGGAVAEDCINSMPPPPPCQTIAWDASVAKCLLLPVQDGTPCSDGDDCTVGDVCLSGACQKGPNAPSPSSCQTALDSIQKMPAGTTTLDFDTCAPGCASCLAGGVFPTPLDNTVVTCSIDAALAQHGITHKGGMGTVFVDCIHGNPTAPIGHEALFAGGSVVELSFTQGAKFFGFSALPSSSDSAPTVKLEGYTSDGVLVGADSFTYTTPGGDCTTSNPAARFFGFRACCGKMSRVVVTFSDANTVMDTVSFW